MYDINGVRDDGCGGHSCLVNVGPFKNLQSPGYWNGVNLGSLIPHRRNGVFSFGSGSQYVDNFLHSNYVLPVRVGDVANVPVGGPLWLISLGFCAVSLLRHRHKNSTI